MIRLNRLPVNDQIPVFHNFHPGYLSVLLVDYDAGALQINLEIFFAVQVVTVLIFHNGAVICCINQ